jgi:hypothetical protein
MTPEALEAAKREGARDEEKRINEILSFSSTVRPGQCQWVAQDIAFYSDMPVAEARRIVLMAQDCHRVIQ